LSKPAPARFSGAVVVRDACAKEKTQGKRIGKRHLRSGGNAGATVNLQRIGAIACHGPLAREGL
jgi:hypothetical protein